MGPDTILLVHGAGDLLLVDAAANYQYYTVDITRTYPVSGKFSEPQKDIYRIVLAAQDAARQIAAPGTTLYDVHQKTVDVIKAGLLRLGLITDAEGEEYRTWYTHGAVHYLGMDVHDVGDPRKPLAPGQAFVIEPGIYIREEALDSLPKTDKNLAFIEKVRPAFEKYRGIGVRVEDSFLLTEEGLEICRRASLGRSRRSSRSLRNAETRSRRYDHASSIRSTRDRNRDPHASSHHLVGPSPDRIPIWAKWAAKAFHSDLSKS